MKAKISRAEAAKLIGFSYDALKDALKGTIKDSKLELVVKICYITGRTINDWCDRMLDGVNDEVANQVRSAFTIEKPTQIAQVSIDSAIEHCLDSQEKSAQRYQTILHDTYNELLASKEQMRQHYEKQIAYLEEENKRLLEALIKKL